MKILTLLVLLYCFCSSSEKQAPANDSIISGRFEYNKILNEVYESDSSTQKIFQDRLESLDIDLITL